MNWGSPFSILFTYFYGLFSTRYPYRQTPKQDPGMGEESQAHFPTVYLPWIPRVLFDISIIKNKAILLTSPLLGTVSFLGDLCLSYVVVQVQVGKQFPDMRQNEREVKFIRVRRASGLCCLLEQQASSGRTSIEQGSLVHFYTEGTRSGIRPCGSFADWRRHVY